MRVYGQGHFYRASAAGRFAARIQGTAVVALRPLGLVPVTRCEWPPRSSWGEQPTPARLTSTTTAKERAALIIERLMPSPARRSAG